MKNKIKTSRMSVSRLLFSLTIVLLILAAIQPRAINSLEDGFLRLCTGTAGGDQASDTGQAPMAIAAVDERSIEEIGRWPWPRGAFLTLLERLRSHDVGLVVFESSLADEVGLPDMRLPLQREGGTDLIVGYDFYPRLADMPAKAVAGSEGELKKSDEPLALPASPGDMTPLRAMAGIRLNRFTPGERQMVREGFGNIFPDPDGIVRSSPLAVRFHDRVFPSLSLAAAAEWMGFTPIVMQSANGEPTGVAIGDRKIRTGGDLDLQIEFRGASSFPRISVSDIIAGKIPRERIENRIVLVGVTDKSLHAPRQTPTGPMADIELVADEVDNLLRGAPFLRLMDRAWTMPSLLILGFIYSFAFTRLKFKLGAAAGIATIALPLASGFVLLKFYNIQLPTAHLATAAALYLAASSAWHIIEVWLPREKLRAALRGRMRLADIDRIADDPSLMAPRGRQARATAVAADIKGFGRLSSALGAAELTAFLREYRSAVGRALTESGAFIDTWSGDECRAVFGAPIESADHAAQALHAALAIRCTIAEKQGEWGKRHGVQTLRLAIGIQSGMAVLGDVGGSGSTGFGITGEAVEGSRQLCILNRLYRTSVLVGDETKRLTEERFAYRPLDPVDLAVGLPAAAIHELLGEKGTILPQLDQYLDALGAYLKGDFGQAIELFSALVGRYPNDGPSRVLLKRAESFAKEGPQWYWDGVWRRG